MGKKHGDDDSCGTCDGSGFVFEECWKCEQDVKHSKCEGGETACRECGKHKQDQQVIDISDWYD